MTYLPDGLRDNCQHQGKATKVGSILEVGEVGSLVSNGLEVVDGDVDIRRACHGEDVKDGISGTTDDVDDGNSVQE